MHFTVHEASAYLVTVIPDAWRRIDSFLIVTSPCTAKSAPFGSASVLAPSSDHVRKPNDLIRSLRRFSATGDGSGGAPGWSASVTWTRTDTFGSPFARISSMRS